MCEISDFLAFALAISRQTAAQEYAILTVGSGSPRTVFFLARQHTDARLTRDMLYGHFGPRTLRPQDTSAPIFGAEVSRTLRHRCRSVFRHFGTGTEMSQDTSGRCSRLTARSLVAGPQAWNRLPAALRQLKTVGLLFMEAYCVC